MTGSRKRPAILLAGLLLGLLAGSLQGVQGEELEKVPSEDQCRPYIEKALKDLGTEGEHAEADAADSSDEGPEEESAADTNENDEKSGSREKRDVSAEEPEAGDDEGSDKTEENENEVDQEQVETVEIASDEDTQENESVQVVEEEAAADSKEEEDKTQEAEAEESQEGEQVGEGEVEGESAEAKTEEEQTVAEGESAEQVDTQEEVETNEIGDSNEVNDDSPADNVESDEQKTEEEEGKSEEEQAEADKVDESAEAGDGGETAEDTKSVEDEATEEQKEESKEESKEDVATEEQQEESKEEGGEDKESNQEESAEDEKKSVEEEEVVAEAAVSVEQEPETTEVASEETKEGEDEGKSEEKATSGETKEEEGGKSEEGEGEGEAEGESKSGEEGGSEEGDESRPEEEELIMEIEIPEILRPRDHIGQLLKLNEENEEKEQAVGKIADVVLRDLKRLYDNAIKPLETLYKYRDLSNRHFGDPEIFSKPLVLFMGPWSGGKSSIINYLLDIEYKSTSLRTGAEPSPAYFNILMHGEENEVLDGTQLAADWTFSGLQKFGQGLLDRLKGFKLKNKLLEKVNIVEIPGILEIRKQVQRLFPFNDACQWFIDRADIIFLVYDPSKLDVGPETEAILDQLKGREYQTRIILNKADQVKPEELMRVQGALIWNISPLMSSAEPPIMYSASLWSIPYEAGAPTRLLYAQERAFLRDLRSAIDKRVEHKIASARRFAVRVRNHAKMVDCYLTTFYNHKSFFAKKKDVSDRIIENPQDYHIYEGLSTLTNISRYDLPDPDVYRDFFRLNPLYDFPLLSTTCTYFRGCPINRLDVSIAYDLPELVGKYKKSAEAALHQEEPAAPTPAPAAQHYQSAQAQKPTARSGASRISLS